MRLQKNNKIILDIKSRDLIKGSKGSKGSKGAVVTAQLNYNGTIVAATGIVTDVTDDSMTYHLEF